MLGTAWTSSSTRTCERLQPARPLQNLTKNKIDDALTVRGGPQSQLAREFALPPRDNHARDAISQNRDRGAPHIHELIDRKKKKKRLHGQVKRSCRRKDN